MAEIYQDSFPIRFAGMYMLNSGLFLRMVMRLVKLFLKKKLRERMVVCTTEELFEAQGFDRAAMPAVVGGTAPDLAYTAWLDARLARAEESNQAVRI